jgi:hypothetical protein
MVDKVALGQVLLRVLQFSSVSIIPPRSALIFFSVLLFPEGQKRENREPSKKNSYFWGGGEGIIGEHCLESINNTFVET